MGILFIVALVLAWPTFGLSLVAWFVLLVMKGKAHANRAIQRERVKEAIEPLFEDRFSEFFSALDMPIYGWEEISDEEAHQCGRHIMNYISHNPSETLVFIRGLKKLATKGTAFCDPITAAEDESRFGKGEVHLVCYRAVEALMTNNKLKCFAKVDIAGVIERKASLELKQLFSSART